MQQTQNCQQTADATVRFKLKQCLVERANEEGAAASLGRILRDNLLREIETDASVLVRADDLLDMYTLSAAAAALMADLRPSQSTWLEIM